MLIWINGAFGAGKTTLSADTLVLAGDRHTPGELADLVLAAA